MTPVLKGSGVAKLFVWRAKKLPPPQKKKLLGTVMITSIEWSRGRVSLKIANPQYLLHRRPTLPYRAIPRGQFQLKPCFTLYI